VKFQIKFKTKDQIKCLKVNLKMIQRFIDKIKSEQIINKSFLFILLRLKNVKPISFEWPLQ
jgi:hypothetical protein